MSDYQNIYPKDRHCIGELGHTYLIRHRYDIGDQGVTITAPAGVDARRAAIYIQFQAEIWFGNEKLVTISASQQH